MVLFFSLRQWESWNLSTTCIFCDHNEACHSSWSCTDYKYTSDWPMFLESQIWDWNAVFKHELIGEVQVKLDEVQLNRTGASAEIW